MEAQSQPMESGREISGWRLFVNLFWSLANVLGWTVQMFKWE